MNQSVKVVGRAVVCYKCKELAAIYCPCGAFLCELHYAGHTCLITSSMNMDESWRDALA